MGLLLSQHIGLVAISTGFALLIGLPLGVLVARRPAWRRPVLGLANVFQTIPSLALFGLLIPVFGIGAWTAITALVVYALLPIVRNTYTGITAIGAGGLGVYIFRGVATVDDTLILAGAIPAALLALLADALLGFAERRLVWRPR